MGAVRRFGGKLYRYHSRHALKKWADDEAKTLRDKGKSVRVVNLTSKQYPYEVFIRP